MATRNRKSPEAKGIDQDDAGEKSAIFKGLGLSKGSLAIKKLVIIKQGGEKEWFAPIVRTLRRILRNTAASVALTCIRPKKRPKETISA